MNYYSEFGEDRWIGENLSIPENGVYVDVGCAWPKICSNTGWLRDRGWTGLAIDGSAYWKEMWEGVEGATFVHAVVGHGIVNWGCDAHPTVSRIKPDGEVRQAFTLEAILEENQIQKIDFMSLDVEGHEHSAFRTMEWERHRPKIVVTEYLTHNPVTKLDEMDNRLLWHLIDLGYVLKFSTGSNHILELP